MKSKGDFDGDSWVNPAAKDNGDIAIIGCGNFAFSTIAYYLKKSSAGKIKYALDIKKSQARSLAEKYNVYCATINFDLILEDKNIRIIYIASNHHSHATYAVKALEAGKDVHIEKPHAVSLSQLNQLVAVMISAVKTKTFLGFNRPKSILFKKLMKSIDQQTGPIMVNWFIAGHGISDDHWYFDKQEGGRVLGNLCHWSDLTIHLVGLDNCFPCSISPAVAVDSKSDFSVSISFADGSQAGLTFSAKGHTFEGVREYLNVHKGNLLANLRDFGSLELVTINKTDTVSKIHRDHGHKENILHSYISSLDNNAKGEDPEYVYATGLLILKIKEAIETGKVVKCNTNDFLDGKYTNFKAG
jgi:predicted dehydrogenase